MVQAHSQSWESLAIISSSREIVLRARVRVVTCGKSYARCVGRMAVFSYLGRAPMARGRGVFGLNSGLRAWQRERVRPRPTWSDRIGPFFAASALHLTLVGTATKYDVRRRAQKYTLPHIQPFNTNHMKPRKRWAHERRTAYQYDLATEYRYQHVHSTRHISTHQSSDRVSRA